MNPFQEAPNSKKMRTLYGLYLGVISQMFISLSFSGMLPLAAQDFSDGAIWPLAISIGGILGLCAMPIYGYLGATKPHIKRILAFASLSIGAVVLLLRGIAPSMMVIVFASAFWGLVSAGIFVIGYPMVRDMFDQQKAGTYLGVVGSVMSFGMLVGPFLAGFLMDRVGWRPINFIVFAMMAVAALMMLSGVSVTKAQSAHLAVKSGKFDFAGAAAMAVFLACVIIDLSMTSYFPLGGTVSNTLWVIAVVALIVFIAMIARKKDAAFVPLKVFKDRNSLIFSICNFLASFSVMGFIAFMPAFIRTGLSADPLVTTIGMSLASLLPSSLSAVLGLPLGAVFGKMIAKSGDARTVLTIGTLMRIVVYGGLLLCFLGIIPMSFAAVCVFAFLLGVSLIQNSVTYSAGPQIQIAPELRVQSNSIVQLGQNLGSGVAVPLFTLVIALSTQSLIAEGMDAQAAGAMGLVSAMPVMFAIGLAAIVVLLFVGLTLKPLPKQETAVTAPEDKKREENGR